MTETGTELFAFYIPHEWARVLEARAAIETVSKSAIGRRALARELRLGVFAAPEKATTVSTETHSPDNWSNEP